MEPKTQIRNSKNPSKQLDVKNKKSSNRNMNSQMSNKCLNEKKLRNIIKIENLTLLEEQNKYIEYQRMLDI